MSASPRGTQPAKRKVRKGTQSCWECKRRKIRCTFASPTDAVCDGCKSRLTRCIGQEYEDDPRPAGKKADRLRRLECVIKDFVTQERCERVGNRYASDRTSTVGKHSEPTGKRHASDSSFPHALEAMTPEELSNYLISFWPSEADLDLIADSQVCTAFLLHGMVCQPYDDYYEGHKVCLRRSMQQPADDMHPVLLARSMMLLVTMLDSLPSTPAGLAVDPRSLKERLYNAATKLVTSHHDAMPSLEGVECHLMEVRYLSNMGNLRRAWLANRRAISLAQMMGLQTGKSSAIIVIEEATRDHVRPDHMWFRLLASDRHLSLLLGLPQVTTENFFATPEALETHVPLERFERIMIVACGLILQRNDTEHNDLDTTYEIDKTLQRAARVLTPDWWLVSLPALTHLAGNDAIAFRETTRLINQFTYHHLLVQLHLPYILLPSTSDPRINRSKITVANASRAILTRFISLHNSPASVPYCRAIDFFSFIASTTLCLVHIDARRQQFLGHASSNGLSPLQPLCHQRHSDRGLLQSLLEIVTVMVQAGPDPIAERIASILGPLLEIELNSSKGGCYSVSSTHCGQAAPEKVESAIDFGDPSYAPHMLHIKVPFFGTVSIQHHPDLSIPADSACTEGKDQNSGSLEAQAPGNGDGVNSDRLKTSSVIRSQPRDWADASTLPDQFPSLTPPRNEGWVDDPMTLDQGNGSEQSFFVPDLSSEDHWALQGVDIALFSNLTQGS